MGRKNHPVHFRRCHVCGAVTEQEQDIDKCDECGKSLAPFFYYDDKEAPVSSEDQERPLPEANGVKPLVGLTAYW